MEKIEWSKVLQNLAYLSQVFLAGAVIFAYFYTVNPLHQIGLLDEQIANKILELEEKENDVKSLSVDMERLDIQKSSLDSRVMELENSEKKLSGAVAELNIDNDNLKKSLASMDKGKKLILDKNEELTAQNDILTRDIKNAEKRLPELKRNLREAVFREYIVELRRSIPGTAVSTFFANEWIDCVLCPQPLAIKQKVRNINPGKIILESLEYFEHIKWLPEGDQTRFKTYITGYVKNHKDELDFNPETAYLIDKYLSNPGRNEENLVISAVLVNEAHYKEVIFMVKIDKVLNGIAKEFVNKGFIADMQFLKNTK
jgi:hypothetical protein